jgi:hypothetical protein
MTEATEVQIRRRTRWLTAWVVTVGLVAGVATGSGVAWADDGSTSKGGAGSPSSSSATSSGGEDASPTDDGDRSTTLPRGIRIADRALNDLNDRGGMESLRLQMAMDRLSKLMSTLSNVLKKANESAQTITDNIK